MGAEVPERTGASERTDAPGRDELPGGAQIARRDELPGGAQIARREEIPRREIRDPQVLRAMAHPVRLRLIEELTLAGPLTATQLGERIAQSAANCSWHLRQLARYGFVEEAGGGTGRQRPWRVVVTSKSWGEGDLDDATEQASATLSEILLAREYDALRTALPAARREPMPWRDAPFVAQALLWLTADELVALGEEIRAALLRYLHRLTDPASRPAGSRPVRFLAWGVPARPLDQESNGLTGSQRVRDDPAPGPGAATNAPAPPVGPPARNATAPR